MILRQYADVHPNWYIIRTLDRDEVRALLDLTLTLMSVSARFTPEERSAFVHELFDDRGSHLDPEGVQVMVWQAEDRLAQYDNKQLGKRLGKAAAAIRDDVKRIACMRLLAIVAMAKGTSVRELNFCHAVGYGFRLDEDTIQNILRAAWESQQSAGDAQRLRARPPRQPAVPPAAPGRGVA